MTKHLVVLMLIISLGNLKTSSQNAFYDSKAIVKLLNEKKDTLAYEKMISYFIKADTLDVVELLRVMDDHRDGLFNYLYRLDLNLSKVGEASLAKDNTYPTIATAYRKLVAARDKWKLAVADKSRYQMLLGQRDSLTKESQVLAIKMSDSTEVLSKLKADSINVRSLLDEIAFIVSNDSIGQVDQVIETEAKSVNGLEMDLHNSFLSLNKVDRQKLLSDAKLSIDVNIDRPAPKTPDFSFVVRSEELQQQNEAVTASKVETGGSSLTNFKMPAQSEIIDALAIFIAKRFRQEMSLTLMTELRRQIAREPLIGELFPQTIKLLDGGGEFELPRFGKAWNYSISDDFINLPLNISNSTRIGDLLSGGDSVRFQAFQDVVRVAGLVIKKNSIPEIVNLHHADTNLIKNSNLRLSFDLLYLINHELFTQSGKTSYWIPWTDFEAMSTKEFTMLFKLLEGRYADLHSQLQQKMATGLKSDMVKWRAAFKSTISKSLVLLNAFQKSQQAYLERVAVNPMVPYPGINFWDFQQELFSVLLSNQLIKLSGDEQTVIDLMRSGLKIYKLIEDKQYAAMVGESVDLLSKIMAADSSRLVNLLVKNSKLSKDKLQDEHQFLMRNKSLLTKIIADLEQLKKAKVNEDLYNKQLTQLYTAYQPLIEKGSNLLVLNSESKFRNWADNVTQDNNLSIFYGSGMKNNQYAFISRSATLFTDIMSASTSQQLAAVIESYSLPANSYKIKRNSRFSIDLNAYAGGYVGLESAWDSVSRQYQSKSVYGLSAPVGITFSWGFRRNAKGASVSNFISNTGKLRQLRGSSMSASFSIIDIAAVVSYRLDSGYNAALPREVKWSQILSPGMHLRYGFKNSPLNISLGAQYTPQLRNLNSSSIKEQAAWRASLGLSFDIPLFNIYRRSI